MCLCKNIYETNTENSTKYGRDSIFQLKSYCLFFKSLLLKKKMFWFFFGKFCINADKCDDNCIKTGTSGTEIDKDV